jgi:hypothetical protein
VRRILYYVIGAGLVFYGWHHYRQAQSGAEADALAETGPANDPPALAVERPDGDAAYSCDGRVYCSQMHSCEEATWVLQHCPGVKMDGEGDGVPCERQWCGHH